MIILVDAMGGDNAPNEIVKGCIDAVNEKQGFDILLIGEGSTIESILKQYKYSGERIKIQNATEIITNEDIPTKAIKSKKDSSMVVGYKLLKNGTGDVFVSAGNTGALLTGALFLLGRIKGVDRPALSSIVPTRKGNLLLVDAGANTICKPINYLQFGIMGYLYMKDIYKLDNPKEDLVNVGIEEKKGTEAGRNVYSLLSNANINFIGNIEGRQVALGDVDIAVCDGFVGNVLLKYLEGVGPFFFGMLKEVFSKNIITKLSYMGVKSGLGKIKKRLDYQEVGGVPLLGVDGKVIKCHGSSGAKAIKNAVIKNAYNYAESTVVEQIRELFKNMEVDELEHGN